MSSPEQRERDLRDIDAILANEGFKPEEAPQWYKDLKAQYIQGAVSSDEMTKTVLHNLKNNNF